MSRLLKIRLAAFQGVKVQNAQGNQANGVVFSTLRFSEIGITFLDIRA